MNYSLFSVGFPNPPQDPIAFGRILLPPNVSICICAVSLSLLPHDADRYRNDVKPIEERMVCHNSKNSQLIFRKTGSYCLIQYIKIPSIDKIPSWRLGRIISHWKNYKWKVKVLLFKSAHRCVRVEKCGFASYNVTYCPFRGAEVSLFVIFLRRSSEIFSQYLKKCIRPVACSQAFNFADRFGGSRREGSDDTHWPQASLVSLVSPIIIHFPARNLVWFNCKRWIVRRVCRGLPGSPLAPRYALFLSPPANDPSWISQTGSI